MVVPFWGSYIESYQGIPKRNYYGAYGYCPQKGLAQQEGRVYDPGSNNTGWGFQGSCELS